MTKAKSEDRAPYLIRHNEETAADIRAREDETIARALHILDQRAAVQGVPLDEPGRVAEYLRIAIGQLEHEEFGCLFLNAQNRLIRREEIFRGTLTQTSVYPREIVKAALACNAAAAICYHNHPSGLAGPSQADRLVTTALKKALELIDVRLFDHFIVTSTADYTSFASNGLL